MPLSLNEKSKRFLYEEKVRERERYWRWVSCVACKEDIGQVLLPRAGL